MYQRDEVAKAIFSRLDQPNRQALRYSTDVVTLRSSEHLSIKIKNNGITHFYLFLMRLNVGA